jgi:hypothetical protein
LFLFSITFNFCVRHFIFFACTIFSYIIHYILISFLINFIFLNFIY